MRRQAAWALLCLIALSSCLQARSAIDEGDEYEDEEEEERAHLVVRKTVKEELIREGSNVTIVITVFNAGVSTAVDVRLKDAAVPEATDLLTGTLTQSFKHITPGHSEVHEYVLRAKQGGVVRLEATRVDYSPRPGESDTQVSWSTSTMLVVLTTPEYFTRYILMAGQYATFGMIRSTRQWLELGIVVSVIGLLVGANWLIKVVSDARVTRNRRKAQRALGLSEKTD